MVFMKTSNRFSRHVKSVLLAAGLAASSGFIMLSATKNVEQPFEALTLATVDDVVEEEMIKQEIVGCAVGVVQNGIITHVKGYGHTNRLRSTPVSTNTVFRWASVSKTLTAVAAFKAIEDKKLSLNDKVTKHLDYWPKTGNKDDITIAQLFNHRSGIEHYGDYRKINYVADDNFNAEQCVNVFSYAALKSTPGTQYLYSTFGYNLLGAVVEGATNIAYEKYVDDNIADKVGMNSLTGYSEGPGGFTKDCNAFIKEENEGNVEWKLPGGGWASNINDMAKFLKGLTNGTFLANTAALWQPVSNNSGYSFGTLRETLAGELHIWHNGAHDDVRTYLGFFPNLKTGVVVMINGGSYVDVNRFAKKIETAIGKNWNLTSLPRNYCGDNKDCGVNTTGVWRKTNTAENTVLRRGYNTDEFNAEWRFLLDGGYYCADLETYMDGLTRKWDGIFKKTSKQSAMWRNFSSDGFHDKWVEMSGKGYRLIDVETYMDGLERKWAGLFIEMTGSYALHRGMSSDELHNKWVEYGNKGLKLIDIEQYGDDWAGVWIAGPHVAMYRNYDTEGFKQKRRDMNAGGWKLLDVETYTSGTSRKWAGLWEKVATTEHYIYGFDYCKWLTEYQNEYAKDGYELTDLEVY